MRIGHNNILVLGVVMLLIGAGCQNPNTASNQAIQEALEQDQNQYQGGSPNAIMPAEGEPFTVVDNRTINMTDNTWEAPVVLSEEDRLGKYIHIETEKGKIVIETYGDTAPLTVSNFISLAKQGYYDGLTFHRREEGFVIQGGDPNGNGTGGPGYTFPDELNDSYRYTRGIVAMANRGPDTNGSQFFVMLADAGLPKAYSIFGNVVEGMEIVDEIAVGDVMTRVTIEDSK